MKYLFKAFCAKKKLNNFFIGFVNFFHPALKLRWEMSETSVTFLDINISAVQDNNLHPVFTTNAQIHTVTYCTHLPTQLTSKTQFHTPISQAPWTLQR